MIQHATIPGPNAQQFERIKRLVHASCGINLQGKESLVQSRLTKRLRALELRSYDEYLSRVEERGGDELACMLDVLTTNKTSFFREPRHFEFLATALPHLEHGIARGLRLWSAGCSSGEEPYTLSIVLHEVIGDASAGRARILATDLSTQVLNQAADASYDERLLEDVPTALRDRYFEHLPGTQRVRVAARVRAGVRLARLNLQDDWPMRGPFDVIFCRNVMIYFDKPTQERLVNRFQALLAPGGLLFVGHAESLSGLSHSMQYVQPAVYRR